MYGLRRGKTERYGRTTFGEIKSMSAIDFEKSFINYFADKEITPSIKQFGMIKFGEIDNPLIKDFGKSLKNYFS